MLSSLLEKSKSKIVFPACTSSYSVSELIDIGFQQEASIQTGNWTICKATNSPQAIAEILFCLAEGKNIAVISAKTPDDTVRSLMQKLENEQCRGNSLFG